MHPNALLIFDRYVRPLLRDGQHVLEIGPDRIPSTFHARAGNRSIRWDTIDLQARIGMTHVASGEYRFPLPDGCYDVVFSSQVIEHVRRVWVWMKEVARVCRVGGRVITINPVSWPYHQAPVDCWRIYPDGMRALYEEANLRVELSQCLTLEVGDDRRGRVVPWTSAVPGLVGAAKRHVKRMIGFPIFCAYDTITVGIKESDRPSAPLGAP